MRPSRAPITAANRVFAAAETRRRRVEAEIEAVARRRAERETKAERAMEDELARAAAEDAAEGELLGELGASDGAYLEAPRDLVALEAEMRTQLRRRHRAHASWKEVLVRACNKAAGVDSGRERRRLGIGRAGVEPTVSMAEFREAWRALGVRLSATEAAAICQRFGAAPGTRLKVVSFARELMKGGSARVTQQHGVQKGAFQASQYVHPLPGADERPAFQGKLVAPPCKTGVFAPTGFTRGDVRRSCAAPQAAGLELDFVFGYGGLHNTAPNLFYTARGEVVYYAGALGVVLDVETRAQRYFARPQGGAIDEKQGLAGPLTPSGEMHLPPRKGEPPPHGHDDDIRCLAIHPDLCKVCTGQVARAPCALVWDTRDCRQLARLQHGAGMRGVIAVCFSTGGRRLVTVCSDNRHTVTVWDWAAAKRVASAPGKNGVPPQIFGVVWSPYADEFLTYGVKHMTLWEINSSSGALMNSKPSFGRASPHDVLAVAFLPDGLVLSGCETGEIATWKRGVLKRVAPAHAPGKGPNGRGGGCRVLRVRADGRTMLSGGADGRVLVWDVSRGELGGVLRAVSLARPHEPPPALRSLDCRPGSDVFVAGTSACDVWEVDADPEILVYGHSADLYGCAFHPDPQFAHVYATASDSSRVFIWDARARRRLTAVECAAAARSVAFATTTNGGGELAVGLVDGSVEVFDVRALLSVVEGIKGVAVPPQIAPPQRVCRLRKATSAVDVLAYAPDGLTLAGGTHDCTVELFACAGGLIGHLATCRGHSATVTALDWSADSAMVQSTSAAYELLYFDGETGAPVTASQRNRRWASWSCLLGFPVMGIWPDGADGTDVNSLSATSDRSFLAVADDFGTVRLLNYPCVVDEAPARAYHGHSSHVMGARFSCNDKWLVTTGGHDRATFLWRLDRDMHAGEAAAHDAALSPPKVQPPQRTQAADDEPVSMWVNPSRRQRRDSSDAGAAEGGVRTISDAHVQFLMGDAGERVDGAVGVQAPQVRQAIPRQAETGLEDLEALAAARFAL